MDTFFDRVAPRWDEMRRTLFDDRVRDRAIFAAKIRPGSTAIDVGAGTGFLTEGLLAAGARVIAVDSSQGMVEELRRKWGARVDVRHADGHTLPVAGASVDAVLANMFLHHAEDPARAIGEMARVLRPGGRLVITDMDAHDHGWLAQEHHDRWMGFHRPHVTAWLETAGLKSVHVGDSKESCCATSKSGARADVTVFLASAEAPSR